MFGRARRLLTIAACALATPVAAQAPTPATTAFDGVYQGVSADVSKYGGGGRCTPGTVPSTLTIINGIARTATGDEGTVSPKGGLVLRTPRSLRIDAQIDAQGSRGESYPPRRRSMKATTASSEP
jgi:hypothetical protein